jgi:uncharacterized membrane protein YedE/YeeE
VDNPFGIIVTIFAMSIPVVAIVGGITAGIVKTLSRQKMLELAQKERILALERGMDPEKLPAIELPEGLRPKGGPTFEQRQFRRSNVLMIWGMIISAFGLAMFLGLAFAKEEGWPFMLIFVFVGIAFMLGSRVGRPTREEIERSLERERNGKSTPPQGAPSQA